MAAVHITSLSAARGSPVRAGGGHLGVGVCSASATVHTLTRLRLVRSAPHQESSEQWERRGEGLLAGHGGCAEVPFRQVLPEGGGGGAGTLADGGAAGCGGAGGVVRWASRLVYTSQYQS